MLGLGSAVSLNPSLSRIALLLRARYPTASRLVGKAGALARFRITLNHVDVNMPEDLPHAFAQVRDLRPDAVIVGPDGLFLQQRDRIVEFATSAGIAHRCALRRSDRQGRETGGPPVQEPMKYELVINMKTAKGLGVTVPPSLLLRVECDRRNSLLEACAVNFPQSGLS